MFQKLTGLFRGDGYQGRAIRGTAMTLIQIGGNNVIRLGSNLILTRLLFPEAFGIMALVQVVLTATVMFSDFGFRGAVVQDPRGDDPDFLNTAWTLQIARGLLLSVVVFALAGPAATFYEEPQLKGLIMLTALAPLIGGLESTKSLTASRTLQLERYTVLSLVTQILGIAITILLAWWLRSVWALAIGGLAQPLGLATLSHVMLKGHANRTHIDRAAVGSLLKFGVFIFIASIAGFFANHGDRAVMGKFVELEELAVYVIAVMLASFPARMANQVGERVIFPLYARRPPAESEANRQKINKARRLVTLPLLFGAAALAMIGDPVVRFLYDVRYEAAGPLFVLISLGIMPRIIMQGYTRLPLASGHSGRFAIFQVLSASTRFALLISLVPAYGLAGAVLSQPLTWLVLYVPMLIMIRPYKGWDAVHDVVAFAMFVGLSALVLWWNWEVIYPVLSVLFEPQVSAGSSG